MFVLLGWLVSAIFQPTLIIDKVEAVQPWNPIEPLKLRVTMTVIGKNAAKISAFQYNRLCRDYLPSDWKQIV